MGKRRSRPWTGPGAVLRISLSTTWTVKEVPLIRSYLQRVTPSCAPELFQVGDDSRHPWAAVITLHDTRKVLGEHLEMIPVRYIGKEARKVG